MSWSAYGLARSWMDVFHRVSEEHPPAYWLLMHVWVRWVGDSETLLRLPSALAGVAAIPANLALGTRLYGPREGETSLRRSTATAWLPVYYSQEARSYAFLLLFVTLSSSWLIDIVRALADRRTLPPAATIGYLLSAELACYTHYFGLFFVALQGALVLVLARQPAARRRLASIYAIVLLGYVPWLHRVVPLWGRGPSWLRPPGPDSVLRFARSLFNYSSIITAAVAALWATLLAGMPARVRRQGGGRTRWQAMRCCSPGWSCRSSSCTSAPSSWHRRSRNAT